MKEYITYFCRSAFLNFSALSSTRSWSALILEAVRRTGCLTRSEVEGRRVGSGWIISCQEDICILIKHSRPHSTQFWQKWKALGLLYRRNFTFNKLKNSWESTCGIWGRMPCRILCHFSPLVGRGSAPEALTTVRARANMSAFFRLL